MSIVSVVLNDNEAIESEKRIDAANAYYKSDEFYQLMKKGEEELNQGKGITFTWEEFQEFIHNLVGENPILFK